MRALHRPSQLAWARGIVADVAHHDARSIRRACAVLVRDGDDQERSEARELVRLLAARASEAAGVDRAPRDASLTPERGR